MQENFNNLVKVLILQTLNIGIYISLPGAPIFPENFFYLLKRKWNACFKTQNKIHLHLILAKDRDAMRC